MRRFGYVQPHPSDFVLIMRNGQIVRSQRGTGFFCLPWTQYCIIPSSIRTIGFKADQITRENQGIEVSGFAIWKIAKPERTYLHFNFDDTVAALDTLGKSLHEVVISAIRHQVASMSIEDVLRKRGSIILQLKEELAYIADQWGLEIETVEIRDVRIMSAQLFENMQVPYRNARRLESENDTLEVDRRIEEQRLRKREELAVQEQEFKRRALERQAELEEQQLQQKARRERLKLEEDKQVALERYAQELALFEREQEVRRRRIAVELETVAAEAPLTAARRSDAEADKAHAVALARSDAEIDRLRIDAANAEKVALLLCRQLPEIAARLKLGEVNLDADLLGRIAAALRPALTVDDGA